MGLFRKAGPDSAVPASSGRPRLDVAAFGKHRGWDDHMPPMGLDTEPLVKVKEALYNGVRGNIENDAHGWRKIAADRPDDLIAFKHTLIWRRHGQWFLGRLWQSSDGKGRNDYPFIVCCNWTGADAVPLLRRVSPVFNTFEAECSKAGTAGEVEAFYQRHAAGLRNIAVAASTDAAEPLDPDFVDRLNGGFSDEPMMRVMYRIQTQMGSFDGRRGTRTTPATAPQPQHIRVPAAPDAYADNIIFWFRFFAAFAFSTTSIMVMAPTGEPWVDVVLGEPEETEFFCLRAGPKALPQASEVPYTLDDEFRTGARAALQQLTRGGAGEGEDAGTVRWLKSKLFNRS